MRLEGKTKNDISPSDTGLPDQFSVLALAAAIRTSLRYHRQMGIEQYPLIPGLSQHPYSQSERVPSRESIAVKRVATDPPLRSSQPQAEQQANVALPQLITLQQDIKTCQICTLASAQKGRVAGSGKVGSSLLILGDYSAQEEEFTASTLFGEAEDSMLWKMMHAIGLSPSDVYVTNAVKCCPLSGELLGAESIQHCHGHLVREIELIRPKVVCAMGEVAAHALVGGKESIFRLRGRFHPYRVAGTKDEALQVMVTFHPRFLLKNADLKKAVWQDLQMIRRLLQAQ